MLHLIVALKSEFADSCNMHRYKSDLSYSFEFNMDIMQMLQSICVRDATFSPFPITSG